MNDNTTQTEIRVNEQQLVTYMNLTKAVLDVLRGQGYKVQAPRKRGRPTNAGGDQKNHTIAQSIVVGRALSAVYNGSS